MVKRFVELVVADLEVQEAREYHDKGTKAQKHPYIRLRHLRKGGGKSFPNYEIKDRYVMYRLLKSCDPSLAYDEMMQTLYHVSIEERPPMQDILQGYIDHAETDRIGVWVERRKDYFLTILAVDNTDFTMSHYLHAAELGVYLSRLTRTLEYAATLDLSPESGEFSDSNRLMDWWDKSKLEYENAHITKAGIDGLVNSFYNSFID